MPSTVLVTGGSGYAAAHVIRALLAKGYTVKATVRSEEKGKEVLASHPGHESTLSYVVIPDIAAKDAFKNALEGVEGVSHPPRWRFLSTKQDTNSPRRYFTLH